MDVLAVVDLSPAYEEYLVCTSSFGIYICKSEIQQPFNHGFSSARWKQSFSPV